MKNPPDKNIDDEESLNPPPKNYRVSFTTKILFIMLAMIGFGFYFVLISVRHQAETNFILENSLGLTNPVVTDLKSPINAIDPKDGHAVSIAPDEKTYLLINLWATWCPPCREEMPHLELLQQKFPRLKIVAISGDEDQDSVLEYVRLNHPSFLVLWDSDKTIIKMFNVEKFPETFLIDPKGQIIAQFSGPKSWTSPSFLSYFQKILGASSTISP
jgi:thiol-disulfide isomerase/thioredoxin